MVNSNDSFVQRIRNATHALLGDQVVTHQIDEWCDQYLQQCVAIQAGRGVSLISIAIVGAKGQGKTWVARQLILDPRVANALPTGVLSSEATTHLHWIGPTPPDSLDLHCERYHGCRSEDMLDLEHPYMLLDTPGITDDNLEAAKIAKDALALSPIKLLVVRRDQLRSAITSQLANFTEGAICVPVITCVPLPELDTKAAGGTSGKSRLDEDLHHFCLAMQGSAPRTRFLAPVLVPDFEADGDESKVGKRFASQLQASLKGESLEQIAATRANRLSAATSRLRHRVGRLLETQVPQLSAAVGRLRLEADALPSKAIEAVLGSKNILHSAIRSRLRAQLIAETSMIWFPYRTVLTILGVTHGAWDRLLLSLSGSVPSIFGTFVAWARNIRQSNSVQWEMNEGIRDRLNRQIQDRLEPVQAQFHRAVKQMRGASNEPTNLIATPTIRLSGIEELQSRSRTVFEWGVDRNKNSWLTLQVFGLVGTLIFWMLMSGPIVAIYREYLSASYETLLGDNTSVNRFPHASPSLLFTSVIISILPLMIYSMIVLSWNQRGSKINRIAEATYAEELKLVEELQSTGVISLHYDDALLEHAEFLIRNERRA